MGQDDTKFVINVIYGTMEREERLRPVDGGEGLAFESRVIHRDRDGVIRSISEWEPSGGVILFG